MLEKLYYNLTTAAESILHNKTRALLTSLGIIFGVASVIAMLAIGKGAEQEILEQIKLLGANNVIVTPIVEQTEGHVDEDEEARRERRPFSPGLTLADAHSIREVVPGVASVSPEIVVDGTALRAGFRRSTKLVGVDVGYFEDAEFRLAQGSLFTDAHVASAATVCVIGSNVRTRFFAKEEALGNRIKVGNLWLTVIGVLEERTIAAQHIDHLGIRDFNQDIYIPITTMLLRYENRALLTERDIRQFEQDQQRGNVTPPSNYHQLDRLVIRTEGSSYVQPVAEIVTRMLERRHHGVVDYQVTVAEVLLQQERRTQRIFNIVLAAIASISLLVGGIGIMNIMLASVLERTREIGIRRSIGATRKDIVLQFLIEAITLSFTGGILGILLGVTASVVIRGATGIATVVSIDAVLLAFLVSVSVGLIFGLLPAKRAAEHDPVVALRYE